MLGNRLNEILGTGRLKATRRAHHRTQGKLIGADEQNKGPRHDSSPFPRANDGLRSAFIYSDPVTHFRRYPTRTRLVERLQIWHGFIGPHLDFPVLLGESAARCAAIAQPRICEFVLAQEVPPLWAR